MPGAAARGVSEAPADLQRSGLLRDPSELFGELLSAAPISVGLAAIDPGLDALSHHLTAQELPPEKSLAPKRLREIVAGRLLTRLVLAQMGQRPQPLVARADRSPAWPEGLVGSVTHSDGLCAVAIAHRRDVAELGIDIEPDGPVRPELWPKIARRDERAAMPDTQDEAGGRHVRLLFSAKEAYYKAQYPRTQKVLWHQDVRICFDEGVAAFEASVAPDIGAHVPEPGRGIVGGGHGHLSTSWLVLP